MERIRHAPESGRPTLRLRVPPDARFTAYVRERVTGFAAAQDVLEADRVDFVTAVNEALANAVEHSRSDDTIKVSCWVADNELMATVVDFGIGFDAERRIAESQVPEPFAERGRGLPIMRQFTDVCTVQSEPGKGTSVLLGRTIRRSSQQRRDEDSALRA